MADIKVFVSFEFDKDRPLKESFVMQAHQYGLQFKVKDSSLRESQPEQMWKKTANKAIRDSDWVFILIGSDTHTAHGVKEEIRMANQHKRRVLQVRPQGKTWGFVSPEIHQHSWRWKTIRNHMDGKHSGC